MSIFSKMKNLVLICGIFIIWITSTTGVTFKDCGSKGLVKSVNIDPCPKLPCPLKFNSNVSAKLDFVSKTATKGLTISLQGLIGSIPFPIPLDDPNACNDGVKCPIKPNDENLFSMILNIEPDFPAHNMTIKFALVDDDGNNTVCLYVPIYISQ